MQHLAPLIYDLAIMLGSAAIVVVLFQRIRQPVVLGYLIAGIIVGPYTPPQSLINDIPNIQTLSELGVIFLMFSLGLEFSFQKLTRVGFSASITGVVEVVLMFLVGYAAGVAMQWSTYNCIFLGAALSVSSTTIIIKAIDELNLKKKRFAELVFGVLIIEDLLAILMLAVLSTMVRNNTAVTVELLYATLQLIVVVGGWFLIGYFIMPPLFKEISRYINEETLTIVSVALCLGLVIAAAHYNYSVALGSFIMGSILAETTLAHRIEILIQPIRDIFAAVFFISVGMLIDPMIIIKNWQAVFFLSALTVAGKIITTTTGAFLSGRSLTTSVRAGFSMAQVGEFSFIIVALGVALGVTNDQLYPLIVAVSAVTTFATPYLIRSSGVLAEWLQKSLPEPLKAFFARHKARMDNFRQTPANKQSMSPMIMRFIVNALTIGIIFTLIDTVVFPSLFPDTQETWLTNTLSLFAALIFSSPFIWGMLFSYRAIEWAANKKSTINIVIFVIWFLTLTEIAVLSILYFRSWLTLVMMIGAGIIFFIVAYHQLAMFYHWFERRLVSNITRKKDKNKK